MVRVLSLAAFSLWVFACSTGDTTQGDSDGDVIGTSDGDVSGTSDGDASGSGGTTDDVDGSGDGGTDESTTTGSNCLEIDCPTLSPAEDLPAERTLHSATLLDNGKVLVVGGSDEKD